MKTQLMKFVTTLWIILGIVMITIPAYALPLKIEGAIGIWNHDPNGIINYNGDDVELNSDLALSDRSDINVWCRVEHPVPMLPDIKIQYTPIKVKDSNSGNRPFQFGGYTFDNATQSELEMDIIDVQLYNHLPLVQTASLKSLDFTYGLNFRFLNANAFIQEVQTVNSRSRSFSTPLAMLYAGFRIAPVDSFSFSGDFQGTAYSGNHWYDITAEVQISPFTDIIFLGIGYRYQDFKIDDVQDVTADQTMQGWFAELGFRFE
jgi:outer membrane protein